MLVYAARHVLGIASPPVVDGAVAVEGGRIVAVGRRRAVSKGVGPAAEWRDLGDVALVPALVNAHTHLELSALGENPPEERDYVPWLEQLVERRPSIDPEAARAAAVRAVERMAARGTAAVGDVSNATWIAAVLARSPLPAAVLFLEIYGFRAADAEQRIGEAASALETLGGDAEIRGASTKLRIVLTPHAPHTTSAPLLKALGGRAVAADAPLSIHAAESEAETELLMRGTGPMAAFLRRRGAWDVAWKPPGLPSIEYLDRLGILTPRTLVVHAVHLTQPALSMLQARGCTVVTCPRSNSRLGVGTAPVPRLLAAGIPVALGTDSLASAPDLDLFAEMAALRREHPGVPPAAVLRMATLSGARALRLSRDLGSIEPGKLASLVAVPLADPADDALETVTSGPDAVTPLG